MEKVFITDPSLKALLKSVNSEINDNQIEQVVSKFGINKPIKTVSKISETVSTLRVDTTKPIQVVAEEVDKARLILEQQIDELKIDLEMTNSLLTMYQDENEKIIPMLKRLVESAIYDYRSAYDATNEYNRRWFQNVFWSENAKVEFAEHLLNVISSYCVSNLETLRLISARDPGMLDLIRIPESD